MTTRTMARDEAGPSTRPSPARRNGLESHLSPLRAAVLLTVAIGLLLVAVILANQGSSRSALDRDRGVAAGPSVPMMGAQAAEEKELGNGIAYVSFATMPALKERDPAANCIGAEDARCFLSNRPAFCQRFLSCEEPYVAFSRGVFSGFGFRVTTPEGALAAHDTSRIYGPPDARGVIQVAGMETQSRVWHIAGGTLAILETAGVNLRGESIQSAAIIFTETKELGARGETLEPPSAVEVRALLNRWSEANSACRGISADLERSCAERERVSTELEGLGLCYGRKGEPGAYAEWHQCGPRSCGVIPC